MANYAIFASKTSKISFGSDIEHIHYEEIFILLDGGSTMVYQIITS